MDSFEANRALVTPSPQHAIETRTLPRHSVTCTIERAARMTVTL